METLPDPEPDESWVTVSYTRNGFYEQFVMFLITETGIEYPEYPRHYSYPKVVELQTKIIRDNPETTDGGW